MFVVVAVLVPMGAGAVLAQVGETPLDPIRPSLGCQAGQRPLPGAPGRSARGGIEHLAYYCGIVGTDMEFQSRRDATGRVHDFAFAGTVGDGFDIYDVTDPRNPTLAGETKVRGYQNDPAVRGDIAFQGYDGAVGDETGTPCPALRAANGQGVDIFRMNYNPATARFDPDAFTCVANGPGGAHTITVHPSGDWLAISNPGDRAIDIIDLRGIDEPGRYDFNRRPKHLYRIIDNSFAPQPPPGQPDAPRVPNARCPANAEFRCIIFRDESGALATEINAAGTVTKGCKSNTDTLIPCLRPHDIFFSADGNTLYCACLNSTAIMDVRRALEPDLKDEASSFPTLSIIQNRVDPEGRPDSPNNIFLSHGGDATSDERILVIGDERGGGVQELSCNTGSDLIGALHFYALAELPGRPETRGASTRSPKRLGTYVNPVPSPGPDEFRTERGCTVHVFRNGGNGPGFPGEGRANAGLDGVSSLDNRQLTTAWYGAGVWYLDFSAPPDSAPECAPGQSSAGGCDDIKEDDNTSWGNTLAFNIQPGADTWSAKEYKGHIYAGDLARGFDVYSMQRKRYGIPGLPPPGTVPGGRRRRCLPSRLTASSRGIGSFRVGETRTSLVRRLGAPNFAQGLAFRYCVRGGGRLLVAFSRGGRVRLIASTAPGHRYRRVGRGTSRRTLLRTFRRARTVRRGFIAADRRGSGARIIFNVERRVRSVSVIDRTLARNRRELVRYLREVVRLWTEPGGRPRPEAGQPPKA